MRPSRFYIGIVAPAEETGTASPDAGSLSITGLVPTIDLPGGDTPIPVPVGALSLSGQAPLVSAGSDLTISVPTGPVW